MERRTVAAEDGASSLDEVRGLIASLQAADPTFQAEARLVTSRPPYALAPSHTLPAALAATLGRAGLDATPTGMTFWTDAAILAAAGIPSVLFGPTGSGLHSVEEWVDVASVLACQRVLTETVRELVVR
jgi:acetylornithine deacetylase